MRPAPRMIDKRTMPSISEASKMIQKTVDRPWQRLGDASVGSLVEMFSDGTPVWLTGSTVWLTAVFGAQPDLQGDFDIVFSDRRALDRFVEGSVAELNRRLPSGHKQFEASKNALGGARILHPDGKGVIDAWHLGDNESIAELIMAYPGGPHVRCAYYLSKTPSAGCLFRIVTVNEFKAQEDSSTYYGKRKSQLTQAKSTGLLGGLMSRVQEATCDSGYPGAPAAPKAPTLFWNE